jgi:hypothetical protein
MIKKSFKVDELTYKSWRNVERGRVGIFQIEQKLHQQIKHSPKLNKIYGNFQLVENIAKYYDKVISQQNSLDSILSSTVNSVFNLTLHRNECQRRQHFSMNSA